MAQQDETEKKALILAQDLFSLIDEEELNPPQFTGSMFIGETVTVWAWEWKESDEYGKIVIAEISTDEDPDKIPCAFTAWRTNHYFNVIEQSGLPCPFRFKIVADKRSYKFAPADKR